MKKRIAIKHVKKSFFGECHWCGKKTKISRVCEYEDRLLGKIKFNHYHEECSECGSIYWNWNLSEAKYNAERLKIKELLTKNFSPSTNEYISIEEMSKLENETVDQVLRDRPLNLLVYNMNYSGKRIFLKKSYDLYKKDLKSGKFCLLTRTIKKSSSCGGAKKNLKKVRLNKDFTIEALFEDGQMRMYDMRWYIKQYMNHNQVIDAKDFIIPKEITESFISWDNGMSIDCELIYFSGDVLSFFKDNEKEMLEVVTVQQSQT